MSQTVTSRRRGFEFIGAALATPKRGTITALLFVSLSIPILIFDLRHRGPRRAALMPAGNQ